MPGANRALLYVGVRRLGVQVLEFSPFASSPEDVLRTVKTLSVPDYTSGIHLVPNPGGPSDTLYVTGVGSGIRVFGHE